MIINMTTIAARRTHYIDATLESLAESDGRDVTVNLILGSPDASHVERYRDRFNLVPWDAAAEAQVRPGKPRFNCNLNALRALRYGADDPCLCCEDDIRFEKDWLARLRAAIAAIEDADYVLNLGYSGAPLPGRIYGRDERGSLCGAQGLFYPTKALRQRVADHVEANIRKGTNDELIGRFAKAHCALYTTVPKLVHHRGQVSCFT